MSDLELDAIAEGIFKYIMENTPNPRLGIAVLGVALLRLYDSSSGNTNYPIATFAKDFADTLVESYVDKSDIGSDTIQ